MDDDFNTPVAVAVLFDLARAANRAQDTERAGHQRTLLELSSVLGLKLLEVEGRPSDLETAPFIDLLVDVRNELRGQRLWQLADVVRDRLDELGVIIEDSPAGTTWRARE
jgi:cysteinyl-tRNA synthetase